MFDVERLIVAARHFVETNELAQAEAYYRNIYKKCAPPKSAVERVALGEACVFFAKKALKKSRLGEAGDWYRDAINADPRAVDYRVDMAKNVLLPMGMVEAARIEAYRATVVQPDDLEGTLRAHRALFAVEYERGDAVEARKAIDNALAIEPRDSRVHFDAAILALDSADYETTERHLACVNEKYFGDVMHCHAMIAYREGRHEDAVALYTRVIDELGCEDVELAKWDRALAYHSIGDYINGWRDYESRGTQKTNQVWRATYERFNRPMWQGEPPVKEDGSKLRLHLHEEQGFGDTLQLARYAPLFVEQGYDVSFEVHSHLVTLFQRSFPNVNVVRKAIDYPLALGMPDFDVHCPTLSVPHVTGLTVETIPWFGPYLRADEESVSRVNDSLPPSKPGRRRIGFCWSSGVRPGLWLNEYARRKSIVWDEFRELFVGDHVYVSLQAHVQPDGGGEVFEPKDWDETASVVGALDLVVTIDSAMAHLAAAMGKPVWLLMHTEGSFHWMTPKVWGGRCSTESPWYPTVRLFRQDRPHEWGSVIEAVRTELLFL